MIYELDNEIIVTSSIVLLVLLENSTGYGPTHVGCEHAHEVTICSRSILCCRECVKSCWYLEQDGGVQYAEDCEAEWQQLWHVAPRHEKRIFV